MTKKRKTFAFGVLVLVIVAAIITISLIKAAHTATSGFQSDRAYQDVIYQENLGPRVPGSTAHSAIFDYIKNELAPYGWMISLQETTYNGQPVRNIEAHRGSSSQYVLLGAHYDSRMRADNDLDTANHNKPVPGANDGASGVAILLELGRSLPEHANMGITLLFIDSEDQGRIPGWDWIMGSSAYAESISTAPLAVVIVDMIGDADLNIYREKNSDKALTDEIWQTAFNLGYDNYFINEEKYKMIDDHIPFLEKGIPAMDIIDFDYPYWHTLEDTSDKVSTNSLKAVGETLYVWLNSYNQQLAK